MASINNWVNDELHKILGYSDSATVNFMIAQAKKSTDPENFIQRLQAMGEFDQADSKVRAFATQLLNKVPHAGF
jgi:pre-mRNA-splicing factor ATP-dependent RNA helicase DHX16